MSDSEAKERIQDLIDSIKEYYQDKESIELVEALSIALEKFNE